MKALDLFCGAGGASTGLAAAGFSVTGIEWDADAAATHEAAGHETVRADVAALDPVTFPAPDLLWASPPCFPSGTIVATARGTLPIEDVRVGDLALTHTGGWHPVTATMSRTAPVVRSGMLRATADHPYYVRGQVVSYRQRRRVWHLSDPSFAPFSETRGMFGAVPTAAKPLAVSDCPVPLSPTTLWVVGRWLGDGWLRIGDGHEGQSTGRSWPRSPIPRDCPECGSPARRHGRHPHLWTIYCSRTCAAKAYRRARGQRRGDVIICCAADESEGLASKLAAIGRWRSDPQRTTVRFTMYHRALAGWLRDQFGSGAAGKRLPGWLFGLEPELRAALLDGYLSADGCANSNGYQATTVSRGLAVGLRMLAESLGWNTSVNEWSGSGTIIEGRPVRVRTQYGLTFRRDDGRYSRRIGIHRWLRLPRRPQPDGEQVVYDLTVAHDHSFVADGWVVHNCQAWSRAGKRQGILDQPCVFDLLPAVMAGAAVPTEGWHDERSRLVLEPARWALALRPRLVACEQVPDVLPFWQALARELRIIGYSAWTGLLDSERYGVPQTRTRAYLIARCDGQIAGPPVPTHTTYDPRLPDGGRYEGAGGDLFGDGLLPWVSMADALGWGDDVSYRRSRGEGMLERHGERRDWPVDGPAPTLTGKARSDEWILRTGNFTAQKRDADGARSKAGSVPYERTIEAPAPTVDTHVGSGWALRNGNQSNACERTADEPSGTLFFGNRCNDVRWHFAGAGATSQDTAGQVPRDMDEPAHTIAGKGTAPWVTERPSTTVVGSFRPDIIAAPGYRTDTPRQDAEGSVRVTVAQAAVLQGFPPDYPWRGSKTSRFRQVGNAVPPPVAEAIGRCLSSACAEGDVA